MPLPLPLPVSLVTSVMRRYPSSVIIRPVPTAFLPPPIRTAAAIPTIPVVSGAVPVAVHVPVLAVPVLIVVLAPVRGAPLTLGLLSLVLPRVPEVAAAGAVGGSAAWEGAGAVLVAAEAGRREGLLRVARRVHRLVADLLWHDWRRGRVWYCGGRHHVRKGALSSRCSWHGSAARVWHWWRSGRETWRHWEALPHLVVWKWWPHGTLADGILCGRGHWRRIGHKVWPGRHVTGGGRVGVGCWRGSLLLILVLHGGLLWVKLPQVLRAVGLC